MNTVTKAERTRLLGAAKATTHLDDDGEIVGGFTAIWQAFRDQHGISDARARSYVSKAARLKRGEMVREPGQPRKLSTDAVRVTVYLSADDVKIASYVGNGNVSEGIRFALSLCTPIPRHAR